MCARVTAIFFVESSEAASVCPCCGGELRCRDHRKRILRGENGEINWLVVRRFRCGRCSRYHVELPDCAAPYKHYRTEIISGVIDGVVCQDDADSEDYPSQSTMERWKRWFELNRINIEGHIRNAICRVNSSIYIVGITESYLSRLRESIPDWLETALRTIYNSGERLEAFCL